MTSSTDQSTPATDANTPVGVPPGGGRWTWDASTQTWVELTDNPTPQE